MEAFTNIIELMKYLKNKQDSISKDIKSIVNNNEKQSDKQIAVMKNIISDLVESVKMLKTEITELSKLSIDKEKLNYIITQIDQNIIPKDNTIYSLQQKIHLLEHDLTTIKHKQITDNNMINSLNTDCVIVTDFFSSLVVGLRLSGLFESTVGRLN